MTLGERLRLIRGTDTQKAFAEALGVHENSVANAERRNSATQEYLLRIAEVRNINLHWLLTGHGAMRLEEPAGSLLQEKLSLALTDALRLAYGARYSAVPLETRARAACRGDLPARHRRDRRHAARHRSAGEAPQAHDRGDAQR